MSGLVFTAYRDHKCGGKIVHCKEVITWKSRLKQLECLQPEGSLSRYASSLTDKAWICVFRPYSLLTDGPKRQREFDFWCISRRHQYQWPERQQKKAPLWEQVQELKQPDKNQINTPSSHQHIGLSCINTHSRLQTLTCGTRPKCIPVFVHMCKHELRGCVHTRARALHHGVPDLSRQTVSGCCWLKGELFSKTIHGWVHFQLCCTVMEK